MKQILLERQGYSEHIERMLDSGMVVALTGQRRVGKSCVMRCISDKYSRDSANNIIYIDMEKTAFADISDYKCLERYVTDRLAAAKENYLFIDEVQEISEFERALLSMQSDGACHIMVTGSNAKMLSGELATRLRGRYMSYHIHGLDYEEFIEFHELPDNDESLDLFLQYGGLPQLRQIGIANTDLVDDYLENVFNTIVLRDIIEHENIRNVSLLRTLVRFVSDNIGKQFSARSIVGMLKAQHTEASANMVLNYLEYLCNAYIIDRVGRYNIHGKKILEQDPFATVDQKGVGKLIKMAVKDGREANDDLHVGVCGEHGGDPVSIEFFQQAGLDYVSCSPFRVPVARLAAAQAAVKFPRKK